MDPSWTDSLEREIILPYSAYERLMQVGDLGFKGFKSYLTFLRRVNPGTS